MRTSSQGRFPAVPYVRDFFNQSIGISPVHQPFLPWQPQSSTPLKAIALHHTMSARTPLTNLYSSLLTSARSIPTDPLRPNLQLSTTLENLIHRAFGVQATASTSKAAVSPPNPADVSMGLKEDSVTDRQREVLEGALVALRRLKEDEAMKKVSVNDLEKSFGSSNSTSGYSILSEIRCRAFDSLVVHQTYREYSTNALNMFDVEPYLQYPITAKTLQPPTDPFYYTRIVQGVQRSAQGKARAWWKTFMQVKGEA